MRSVGGMLLTVCIEDLPPRYIPSWKEDAEKARASALGEHIAKQFQKIVEQVRRSG